MLQYVEIRDCFNLNLNWWFSVVLLNLKIELCICSGMEFQNEGPDYLIVNFHVVVLTSCIK